MSTARFFHVQFALRVLVEREGAPAEVNYDDQYDDLNDEALDFDQFDQLGGGADEDQPDWAKSLESGSGDDASPSPRRAGRVPAAGTRPRSSQRTSQRQRGRSMPTPRRSMKS